jgi:tetratricopeptide (TPR) repeat protein
MTDLACRVVHRLTGGNARLINQVCDVSLAYGFAEQAHSVTAQLVIRAATDRSASGILPLTKVDSSDLISDGDREAEQQQLAKWSRPVAAPKPDARTGSGDESAAALYKRGVAFKEAGAFKQAMAYFEQAGRDAGLAVKARTQIALCLRAGGRTAESATAFQKLWNSGQGTAQERRQIRYLLARTLEVSGRPEDALVHYRALRDEQSDYRDVTDRLGRLSGHGVSDFFGTAAGGSSWIRFLTRSWGQLLRSSS